MTNVVAQLPAGTSLPRERAARAADLRIQVSSATVTVAAVARMSLRESAGEVSDSVQLDRLAALGRAWGVAKYFHPAFLTRDVDWDAAAVDAIPRVQSAQTTADFTAAVQGMLDVLRDPSTHVSTPGIHGDRETPPEVRVRWEQDSTVVLAWPGFAVLRAAPWRQAVAHLQTLLPLVQAAHRLVFDLRGSLDDPDGDATTVFREAGISAVLPMKDATGPVERRRMYRGFPSQTGGGVYRAGTYSLVDRVEQFPAGPGTPARPVVFLIDPRADVPTIAWALQCSGQALIVMEGPHRQPATSSWLTVDIPLGEGAFARTRVGELISECTGRPVEADTNVVKRSGSDAAMDVALALVAQGRPAVPSASGTLIVPPLERAYSGSRYPAQPYRILAAYRWWTAIEHFYPHKATIGEPWAEVLPQSITQLAAAGDSLVYALAIAEMVARINDTHANVFTPVLRAYRGSAPAGVLVQYIEGLPVVIRVASDSATNASGITVGDVITTIDGIPAEIRRAQLGRYLSASTPQSLDTRIARDLVWGMPGSLAEVVVERGQGESRTVRLPRRVGLIPVSAEAQAAFARSGPVLTMLPGNIGYADLSRLDPSAVDSMFTMFRDARGIVFDGRGHGQGTGRDIASHLTTATGDIAGRNATPLVMSPEPLETALQAGIWTLPVPKSPMYAGLTVLLIDGSTFSAGELDALQLKQANGTIWVGTPTAGANGSITTVVMPGGILANFTGMDVRLPDGGSYQRIGLIPDIEAAPTIAGIRAGRDELLERALEYMRAARE